MGEQMDLKSFLTTVKKRFKAMIITALSIVLLSGFVSFFVMKPTYEVIQNIVIGNLNVEGGYGQELNMLLASTIDFIKSPSVLNTVTDQTSLTYEEVNEMVVVRSNNDSQIINVVVRSSDPDQAQQVADLVVMTTVDKMNSLFGVQDITVLSDPAGDNQAQQVGGFVLNIGIGFVVGLLAGIGVAMFREHLDDSVSTGKEVEDLLHIPVLGEVDMKKRSGRSKKGDPVELENDLDVAKKKRGQISV
ncbi:hypothetical protein EQV77_09755 [Halobacillus fulvus]|nr:hypothetical protein EQV77_09755 [Halobacillus fulvus]